VRKRNHILAATGCALALLAAGCGSDNEGKPIPRGSAQVLDNQLQSIRSRVNAGACRDVTDGSDPNTTVVQNTIDRLPSNVDKDVRDALEESFQNLFRLVRDQCENTKTEKTTTEPPPPTVTETPTVTQTAPTETTTAPPTNTTPKKPKKPKKPKEGASNGLGGGGLAAPEGD